MDRNKLLDERLDTLINQHTDDFYTNVDAYLHTSPSETINIEAHSPAQTNITGL